MCRRRIEYSHHHSSALGMKEYLNELVCARMYADLETSPAASDIQIPYIGKEFYLDARVDCVEIDGGGRHIRTPYAEG
jgi:hypothetical protein